MRLSPEMVKLVVERRKTQIRIPVDGPPRVIEVEAGRYKVVGVCPYRIGRRYKVGGLAVTVREVRQEPLEAISQQDVHRQGFRFPAEFREAWTAAYGSWNGDVWVVSFAAGDLRNRFDVPRLLKATPGRAGAATEEVEEHQDYTERLGLAMGGNADPGEGLSEADLAWCATDARKRDQLRARQQDAEVDVVTVIRDLQRDALLGDLKARRDLFVIHQRVMKAQKRRRAAA